MNERKADNLGLNSQSVHIDQDWHEDSDCAGTEHLSPPRPATIPVARVAATPPGRPATHRPQPPPLCPAAQPHVARSPRPPRPESPERPPGPALPAAASLHGSAASGLAAPAATKMRFEGCTKETRHPGCNQAEGAEPSTPARQNPEAELFLGLSVGFESTATRSASGQGCKVRGLQPCCTKFFSKASSQ